MSRAGQRRRRSRRVRTGRSGEQHKSSQAPKCRPPPRLQEETGNAGCNGRRPPHHGGAATSGTGQRSRRSVGGRKAGSTDQRKPGRAPNCTPPPSRQEGVERIRRTKPENSGPAGAPTGPPQAPNGSGEEKPRVPRSAFTDREWIALIVVLIGSLAAIMTGDTKSVLAGLGAFLVVLGIIFRDRLPSLPQWKWSFGSTWKPAGHVDHGNPARRRGAPEHDNRGENVNDDEQRALPTDAQTGNP